MAGFLKRLFGKGGDAERPLTYDEAKQLARDADPAVRTQLARRGDLKPEILYFLAEDADIAVRREVATNHATPPQADLLLAGDQSEAVRGDLAGKIARLAPGLSPHEQDRLRRTTYEALEMLARDQIPKVRQILSEALKDVAGAPPEVIRRLARDAEIAVAGPVLQFSPVLSDEDLLEIIAQSPIPGALTAISRRPQVNVRVADAIAASDDVDAITELLANPSAQIREETLDRLVDRAADIDAWHHPMVHRPHLSAKTAQKLARMVASSLLQTLADRHDLDAEAAQAVAAVVKKRLDGPDVGETTARAAARKVAEEHEALLRAQSLLDRGQLSESIIDAALSSGESSFVIAALALKSACPVAAVQKIVSTQSSKGIMAVTWKAGLSPVLGAELQSKLLHLPVHRLLIPRQGMFPLTSDEMTWQLEFFGAL